MAKPPRHSTRSIKDPFVCGDFNVISSSVEKAGGRDFDPVAMDEFNQFISFRGPVDTGYVFSGFTWCNNQKRVYGNIYKKVFDAEDEVTRMEVELMSNNSKAVA
ncbi:unnamed protein product [Dovyalis caffra]|uniref:Uncharacterized protein n=1 Tax=Dovyalis caffra TaxID=77055 RepID=A0AAV1S3W9_9ROSI|nr:unnamed protein product [Dovyalis caffra]